MTWSNLAVSWGAARTAVNSLNAAISTVHAPDSCSSMLRTADSGSTPRYGPTARSLNASAAASGSRLATNKPSTPGTGIGSGDAEMPNRSSRLDAGSVEQQLDVALG
jgi:hypothetical protein